MFSRFKKNKNKFVKIMALAMIVVVSASTVIWGAPYQLNNRDTRPEPESMDVEIPEINHDEFVDLYENDNFIYSYKEDNMVIAITDKRNNYTWKSGLDNITNRDIDEMNDDAIRNGEEPEYLPKEDRLNTTYTGIANSLVTLEFYDSSNNRKLSSISKDESVVTDFRKFADDHYVVEVNHREVGVEFNLHIRFSDNGINLSIPYDEIVEEKDSGLAAFYLMPFMGATGGTKIHWDPETEDYSIAVPNEMKPGYVLVPDGPGALIRFRNNDSEILAYEGDIFGEDPSQKTTYYDEQNNTIPINDPTMPVYGIAHGNNQNAFVAYADEGFEYMSVVVQPEENMTNYYWAYPRFAYNNLYFQAYNKRGDGYYTLMENANPLNISMNYDFLAGDGEDGSHAANYVGMAQRYREYLIDEGQLREEARNGDEANIPIRLDFIMADAKKDVLGYKDEILTDVNAVESILTNLSEAGVKNINAGLLGWQKGGVTLASPNRTNFNSAIGSRGEFEGLIEFAQDSGVTLSFVQDYLKITDGQIGLSRNVSRHTSGFYNEVTDYGLPIETSYYARPEKSVEWMNRQTSTFRDMGVDSYTIQGISNGVVSDYTDANNWISRTDARNIYAENISELIASGDIALDRPNSYLWALTDSYLQAPVYSSQQLLQTDNVPFLQMVLGSSMDIFAQYSNFSFYNQSDILRMIDYNSYPSFVLTDESAHLLSDTNLVQYYSTEYDLYKDLILSVYAEVDAALNEVRGANWVDREVLAAGVNINRYELNGEEISIVINYTDEAFEYQGTEVNALDYALVN